MPDVFISYSHKDTGYAHHLADELRRRGIDAWIDERIDYGDQWPRVIQNNLTASRAFILVMSTNSFESMWVHNEASYAQANNKPIYPVLLEGQVWLSMAAMQYVDVRNGEMPPDRFFNELREDLNQPVLSSREQMKPVARKPSPPKSGRAWYIAGSILLCVALMCIATPFVWGLLSPKFTPQAPQPVKVSPDPARPSVTLGPAAVPRLTDTPTPASQINESAPVVDFIQRYGLDPRGQAALDMWFPLGSSYDMDTLTQIYDDTSDLFLENEALLVSLNEAHISGYGHPEVPFLEMCFEILAGNEAPAVALQTDLFYCFQTNYGRHGFVVPRVIDAVNGFAFDVYLFP